MRCLAIFAFGLVTLSASASYAQGQGSRGGSASGGGASSGGAASSGAAATPSGGGGGGGRATAAAQGENPHRVPAREALVRGEEAYVAHDYDGAMSAFREAQRDDAVRAEATLDMGYTQAARGDRDAALASYREALRLATANSEDLNRARALQAIANLFESTQRWPDATQAWQDYVSFVDAHANTGNAEYGRARLQAIRQRDEDEQRWAQVRQRIEQRRQQNARGPQ